MASTFFRLICLTSEECNEGLGTHIVMDGFPTKRGKPGLNVFVFKGSLEYVDAAVVVVHRRFLLRWYCKFVSENPNLSTSRLSFYCGLPLMILFNYSKHNYTMLRRTKDKQCAITPNLHWTRLLLAAGNVRPLHRSATAMAMQILSERSFVV